MNIEKVRKHIETRLQDYKDNYPSELFEDIKINIYNGSFGSSEREFYEQTL